MTSLTGLGKRRIADPVADLPLDDVRLVIAHRKVLDSSKWMRTR